MGASYLKVGYSHKIIIAKKSNTMHVYQTLTKPAYDLSLRYNPGQSDKLFYIFEQQQMKDDENYLASDYYQTCLPNL